MDTSEVKEEFEIEVRDECLKGGSKDGHINSTCHVHMEYELYVTYIFVMNEPRNQQAVQLL